MIWFSVATGMNEWNPFSLFPRSFWSVSSGVYPSNNTHFIFPARAGVNPVRRTAHQLRHAFPRTRGGESKDGLLDVEPALFPRTRGGESLILLQAGTGLRLFPARAGVNRPSNDGPALLQVASPRAGVNLLHERRTDGARELSLHARG